MSHEHLIFRFNRSSKTPGPFSAKVVLEESVAGPKDYWHEDEYRCNGVLNLPLSNLRSPDDYTARLFLDDHLAYANRYQADDLPF